MKKFFLLFLLLIAPAYAGNLGIADQYMSGLREIERLETLPSSFEIHVGQLAVRNKPSFWKKFRENKAVALFENGLYKEYLKEINELNSYVVKFFDEVMINDNEEEIKLNRISLLTLINKSYTSLANLAILSR